MAQRLKALLCWLNLHAWQWDTGAANTWVRLMFPEEAHYACRWCGQKDYERNNLAEKRRRR